MKKIFLSTVLAVCASGTAATLHAQTSTTIEQRGNTTTIRSGGRSSGNVLKVKTGTGNVALNGNRITQTIQLSGQPYVVNGNNNRLTLTGTCTDLTVNGNNNVIDVTTVSRITATGNRNQISWHAGDPTVSNVGSGNAVSQR